MTKNPASVRVTSTPQAGYGGCRRSNRLKFMHRILHPFGLSAALLALTACSEEQTSESGESVEAAVQAAGNPLELEPWFDDFPRPIKLSPKQAGRWYSRSRRAALEQVASNLSGTCTRDAWLLAKEFFRRVPREESDILITTLDRGIQSGSTDLVETTLAAMGATNDPKFGMSIVRAFDLRTRGVESAASRALETCGNREAILACRAKFGSWHTLAQIKWFDAAIGILEPSEVAADIRAVIRVPQFGPILKELISDALQLPAEHALTALEPVLGQAEQVDVTIDALRHATGDATGTARMQEWLRSDSPANRAKALKCLVYGGANEFRDRVLELAGDLDPGVRFEALSALPLLDDADAVVRTLETLALDDITRIRQAALFQLRERGERAMLDDVVREAKTATGTRFRDKVGDLVAARDAAIIPVLLERFQSAAPGEQREYIKSIAFVKQPESFGPLRDVFLAEPVNYSDDGGAQGGSLLSVDYMGILFLNADGAEFEVVKLFRSLPKDDYWRRSVLLETLTGLAVDRDDPKLSQEVYDAMREIVMDPEEVPQMRLLTLQHFKRGITIDDVMALSRQTRKETQQGMVRAINDFLLEYF